MIKKIGITTGGGDCPGLNAVIRAVVRGAVNVYDWEVLGIQDGFDGLISMQGIKELNPFKVRGILPRGGTILGTTNRGNPFKYKIMVGDKIEERDMSSRVKENLALLGIDALVMIGGDGTLFIGRDLMKMGIKLVGVPKTIDNDLSATEVTFGFNTAVTTATDAIDKLHTTAESHHRVMILEVMGRGAGWIALEAGIAGGADVILIPEIPFDLEVIARTIRDRNKKGSKFSIIVVAEGAFPKGGEAFFIEYKIGKKTVKTLGGIGQYVSGKIGETLSMESRVTVLGHLQRGGSPTTYDRFLATRFGMKAVDLIAQGKFGQMVCLRAGKIESAPIEEAVGQQKLVDPEGEVILTAEKLGICVGRHNKWVSGEMK
ncbi:MAG: 6-phosphofructokinase [candidate division Zixibacteria bacterium]|nr:6-phosphofructokinase [Candidatus Tariuqbacter arcticus]